MDTPLEDIAFLANSENRVSVLETLVEAPRSRDGIRDQIDASRVTITRILRELEARHWVEGSGQAYAVTPLGEWVYEEFIHLVDELEAEQRLREPLRWFPFDLLTFDVQCLRDAEIIRLNGSNPTAVVRRILEFHRSGDRIRGVARETAPVFIENQWEVTVQGDTRLELVITPGAQDVIRNHPSSERRFREMLDQENVRFFISDNVPISVGIVDGTVGINLTDEQDVLRGRLVTDDETVHEWAVDLFETYRDNAKPVTPDLITA